MHRSFWTPLLVVFAACCIAGCSGRSTLESDAGPGNSVPPVVVADAASLAEMIGNSAGKHVFVDFWATWCGPCVEQFPHTVQMAERCRDRGLVVISVSMDNLSDKTKVDEFLRKHGAKFANLIQGTTMQQAFEDFQLEQVPTYRLYGPDGEMLRQFGGEISPGEIETLVEQHLGS